MGKCGGVECLVNFKGPCNFLRSLFQIQPKPDPNLGARGGEGRCSVKLRLLLAKQTVPRLGGGGGSSLKRCKQALRPFGHQITLAKQRLDELSVNQSETYGLHFPENTQGFTNYRHRALANAIQVLPNLKCLEKI